MVYMDEWEYHKYLELQSKRAQQKTEKTGYGEVMLEDPDDESSAAPVRSTQEV